MKQTDRLGDLVRKLRMDSDFKELMELVKNHRDEVTSTAIHNNDYAAAEFKRGVAAGVSMLYRDITTAPEQTETRNNLHKLRR